MPRRETLLALALAATCVLAVWTAQYEAVRQRALGEQVGAWPRLASRLTVVSMLSGPEEGAAAALDAALAQHGARRVYLGKVVTVAYASAQLPGLAPELALSAEFPTLEAFAAFRTSLGRAAPAFRVLAAHGYSQNDYIERVGLALLNLGGWVASFVLPGGFDLGARAEETTANPEARAKRDKLVAALASAQVRDDEPILMWNWIRDGSPEQAAADRAYSAQMISLLGRHGGGAMHFGSPVGRSASSALDGTYDSLAAMMYPGAAFFRTMLFSRWMQINVQGKQPGDTLAVMTVPLPRSGVVKAWKTYPAV